MPRPSLWTPSRIAAYARRCCERGLAVTLPDGSRAPIPPMVTARALDDELWDEMSRDGHLLLDALVRVAGEVLAGPGDTRYPRLFGHFREFKWEVMERTWPSQRVLANARIDFFVEAGKPMTLEANTTIPAMHGYADIVNRALVEMVGQARGLPEAEIRALLDRVPSQASNLLDALLTATAPWEVKSRRRRSASWPARITRRPRISPTSPGGGASGATGWCGECPRS